MDFLHTVPDSHGNMLTNIVFLLLSPFHVSQGVTRAECVISAHVVIIARTPLAGQAGKTLSLVLDCSGQIAASGPPGAHLASGK